MEKEVVIKQSLNTDALAKAMTYILFTSPVAYIYCIIYIVFLLNFLLTISNPFDIPDGGPDSFTTPFIALTTIPIFFLIIRKFVAKKAFEKNSRFYTNITYTFSNESFRKEGEGFNIVLKWNEIKKIKESKNWFLLYQNSQQAHIIDKSQIDPEEKDELKRIFRSAQSITKVSLI
jgi:hypothetical protein